MYEMLILCKYLEITQIWKKSQNTWLLFIYLFFFFLQLIIYTQILRGLNEEVSERFSDAFDSYLT